MRKNVIYILVLITLFTELLLSNKVINVTVESNIYTTNKINILGFDWVNFDDACISNIDVNNIKNNYVKNDTPYVDNKGLDSGSLFISPFYDTYINGTKVETYSSYAYIPNLSESTLHSFSIVMINNNVSLNVEIRANIDINSVNVLPNSLNTNASVNNNVINFTVNKTGYYTILVNANDQRYAYTLFVEDYVDDDIKINEYKNAGYKVLEYSGFNALNYINVNEDNTVLYFRKGSCLVGNHIYSINNSNDENIIETTTDIGFGGITRYPIINVNNRTNVKIIGNGIIDLSKLDWHERKGIMITHSNNIEVSRMLFVNFVEWSLTTYDSDDVLVDKVKMFNYRQNTDGIAITNSRNVNVKNSYVRSGDDLFEVKTLGGADTAISNNIVFDNCIGWGPFARGMGITGEVEKDISNVTFKNSAIIYRDATWDNDRLGGLVVIKENGKGNISNVTFDNIEIFHESGRPFNISIYGECNGCSGNIEDITFNNIKYNVNSNNLSLIRPTENNKIDNIKFNNITENGTKWNSPYLKYLDVSKTQPFSLRVDSNNVFTYNLYYDNNGGSGCSNSTISYGDTFENLCTPTKEGYVFIGWFSYLYKDNPLNYYSDTYPDLKNAYGYDANKLYNHYLWYGRNENRRISEYLNNDNFTSSEDITLYAGWFYDDKVFEPEIEYVNNNDKVIVYVRSRNKFKDTKSSWLLSDDGYTYSKEFKVNQNYSTIFEDIYGNKTSKMITISSFNSKPTVNINYVRNNNTITVVATGTSKFKDTKTTWTLSDDGYTYTKTYDNNQNYDTIFEFADGIKVKKTISFIINKYDVAITYTNNSDGTITVVAKSNIPFKNTKTSWKLSNDSKTYTKTYNEEQEYDTIFTSINDENVLKHIKIVKSFNVTITYEKQSDNKIMVIARSNKKLKDTKASWELSSDLKTYTKIYNSNQEYDTIFTSINDENVLKHITVILSYDLTIDLNGGSLTDGNPNSVISIPNGLKYNSSDWFKLPVPVKENAKFLGYFTSSNEKVYDANGEAIVSNYWQNNSGVMVYRAKKPLVIYAKWE